MEGETKGDGETLARGDVKDVAAAVDDAVTDGSGAVAAGAPHDVAMSETRITMTNRMTEASRMFVERASESQLHKSYDQGVRGYQIVTGTGIEWSRPALDLLLDRAMIGP